MKIWKMTLWVGVLFTACQESSIPQDPPPQPPDLMTSSDLLEEEPEALAEKDLELDDLITEDMTPAEKAAIDLFLFQEGTWKSHWTYYGSDGNVRGDAAGTETFSFLVDRYSQMLTNVIPSRQHTSYAMRSFSPSKQHIVLLNIGAGGEYWIMHQNPETGVMISEPQVNPDGTRSVLMFTRTQKTENEMEVVMERSNDDGKTWAKAYTQTLTRVLED